jgi:hypothetical protein
LDTTTLIRILRLVFQWGTEKEFDFPGFAIGFPSAGV